MFTHFAMSIAANAHKTTMFWYQSYRVGFDCPECYFRTDDVGDWQQYREMARAARHTLAHLLSDYAADL